MSGSLLYPLNKGEAHCPGFVAYSNQQVRLAELNALGLGCRHLGDQDPDKRQATQTLLTWINQLHLDDFEGTSACNVNNWLRTLGTHFRLLNIPLMTWLAAATGKLRLDTTT